MVNCIYRFGDYHVSPAARELHFRGELVVLSPKVFDCLAYLIEHRERAVGRDELISAVWGKLDVSDTLLGQTILKGRRAIGDTGNEQNAIRTIPRFGYRWIAEVDAEPAAPVSELGSNGASNTGIPRNTSETWPAPSKKPTPRQSHRRILAAVVIAFVTIGWLVYAILAQRAPSENPIVTTNDARRAVVLPIVVDAPDEFSWVRLGIMDLIATRLRRAGQPVVPSNNVVALVHGGSLDADDASVRLATGAAAVIATTARRTADGNWNVRTELRSPHAAARVVETRGADIADAGRRAADGVLDLLGLDPPDRDATPQDLSLSERLSRAEAALLSDDLDRARALLDAAPAAARESAEWGLRVVQVDYRAGQLGSARSRLDTLLARVSAESDPVLRGRLLNALGAVDVREDHFADAEHAYTTAIALLDNRDQPAALGQAYTGRGICHGALGKYDLALADFSRARIALEIAGDNLALARVEANEALVVRQRGRGQRAREPPLRTLRRAQ